MNKHSNEIDNAFLERLEESYKNVSVEEPSSDLDKQIIAAAHREIAEPNKLKRPNNSWWRRLSLPVTAAATFAFTAIATHILMPEQVGVPPGTTSPRPIKIDLVDDKKVEIKIQERKPRKLPEYKSPVSEPEVTTEVDETNDIALMRERIRAKNDALRAKTKKLNQELSQEEKKAYAESQGSDSSKLAKLEHPEKEEWARIVIELFKKGEFEKAQQELIRFKKVFPEYPIDAQIEAIKSM